MRPLCDRKNVSEEGGVVAPIPTGSGIPEAITRPLFNGLFGERAFLFRLLPSGAPDTSLLRGHRAPTTSWKSTWPSPFLSAVSGGDAGGEYFKGGLRVLLGTVPSSPCR